MAKKNKKNNKQLPPVENKIEVLDDEKSSRSSTRSLRSSTRSSRSSTRSSRSVDKKDIYISEYDEKFMLLQPVSITMKKEWEEVLRTLHPVWKEDKEGWLIKQEKLDELYKILEVELDSDSSGDDSDSTDDELIQKALGRKLMCESAGKVIEKEDVEDSEMEDVVSMSRRFRHIYKELETIKQRLEALEN